MVDRDYNSAINILCKGLTIIGEGELFPLMNQEAITSIPKVLGCV